MTTTTAVRKIAALCPLSPLANEVYERFREPQQVTCPETGETAMVKIDAERAAATFSVGVPGLRIIRCSEWPRPCGRGCLNQLS
jgi:hypothetical protein